MHVGGREVYDDLLSRNPETEGLEGGDGPEQALLDRHVRKADQVDAYSRSYVDFHRNRHGFDADAFRRMDVYQHGASLLDRLKDADTKRQ